MKKVEIESEDVREEEKQEDMEPQNQFIEEEDVDEGSEEGDSQARFMYENESVEN